MIDELEAWCEKRGFARVADLTGAMINDPIAETFAAATAPDRPRPQDLRAERCGVRRRPMTDRITIRKPDDWHLHVRDGAMLKASLPFTAAHFGRAILMPNLLPPVMTMKDAAAYRERVMAALPEGSSFKPLMTCYLTDDTDPDDVEAGFRDGVFTAVKMYPANATTNSAVWRDRLHQNPPRARAHGKDRHDIPDPWRGSRSRRSTSSTARLCSSSAG